MHIVDTHCHAGVLKYEPVESLLHHLGASGVSQAVLIQYGGNRDNTYLVQCLERYPGQLAAAMIVAADDDGTAVRQWAAQGLAGIRLRPDSRAAGADPLAQWRAAAELDLVVSVHGNPPLLLGEAFAEVVAAFPDLRICLEHLGGVGYEARAPYEEFRRVLEWAERPNISMKLPGFGEFCRVPLPFDPIPELPRLALEAFGPERLTWGSDFPPVSSREGYDNALRVPREYFADLSDDEQAWIFGRAAARLWGLAGSAARPR